MRWHATRNLGRPRRSCGRPIADTAKRSPSSPAAPWCWPRPSPIARSQAPEALVYILYNFDGYSVKLDAECDAAYDLLASRYLGQDGPPAGHPDRLVERMQHHSRGVVPPLAAIERSPNLKVKALACFSLARLHDELPRSGRQPRPPDPGQDHGEESRAPRTSVASCALSSTELKSQAEALYERTIKEFADVRPMGKDFPPMG